MNIIKSNESYILKKSKSKTFISLILMLGFYGLWYSALLQSPSNINEALTRAHDLLTNNLFFVLFLIVPLLSIRTIYKDIRVLFNKEHIVLNFIDNVVSVDQKIICNFTDVEHIQIRVISDSDGGDDYRLSIVYDSNKKLKIDQLSNYDKICELSEFLSDFFDVDLIKK